MRKALYFLLTFVVLGGLAAEPAVVMAQSAKQRTIERNRQRARDLRSKTKQLQEQKDALDEVVRSNDQKLLDKQKEVRSVEQQLKSAQDNLAALEVERKQIETDLASYRDNLACRMRATYMQGDMTYLDLLFNAGDFGDFVDRIFFVQTICKRDEDLIGRTQEDQAKLAAKIQQINVKLAEIEEIRVVQRQQLAQMTILQREKKATLSAINSDIKLYQRETAELEMQNKRIAAEIRSGSSYTGKAWKGKFNSPCNGTVTSGYGVRRHPIFGGSRMHTGIDIAAKTGTTIRAAGDGKVISCGWYGGYGQCVIIDHGNRRSTLYGHCSRITTTKGTIVSAGDKIAEVGSTGNSTGPHLHFEVRIDGNPVNPYDVSSL